MRVDEPKPRGGWGRLLWGLSIANAVLISVVSLYYYGRPPLFLIFVVMFGAGRWFMRRGGGAGAIILVAAFLLFVFFNVPFIFPALPTPASTADFVFSVAMLVLGICGVIAGIAVMQRRDEHPSWVPTMIVFAALGVMVLAIFVGIGARLTYDPPPVQPGDLRLTASQLEFSEERLAGRAGAVSVHVVNEDRFIHTLTIDELDVDVAIPAGTSARVTFTAGTGNYEFYCRPFTKLMSGELSIRKRKPVG